MRTANRLERTIDRPVSVEGISFLSGLDVRLTFHPASPGVGLSFRRVDLPGKPVIPALVQYVQSRQRRTTLQHGDAIVEMVEHVLGALAGLQIDNCTVDIDGPETPGCDGSSRAFVEALDSVGTVEQDRHRSVLVIDAPVTVREGSSVVTAHPGSGDSLVLSYNLDYGADSPIVQQSRFVTLNPESFRDELASTRTFLLEEEADALRKAGIGRRTTEADLLIFGPDGPIKNRLRYPDECVRHKLLDMVGDLALLGMDLSGHVVAHRSGHQLNTELVKSLLTHNSRTTGQPGADPETSVVEIAEIQRRLPNRYPFLLIDQIVELDPGRRVVASKFVNADEPCFAGQVPGRQFMPGVLVLEAMLQAACTILGRHAGSGRREISLASISHVTLSGAVAPGDWIRIEVESDSSWEHALGYRGVAMVGSQVVAEARFHFALGEGVQAA